jgi:phage baseplate assembly protein W
MSKPRYRAWRFLYPGLDGVAEEFSGLSLTPRGGIEMVRDSASIRQAILLLLSTVPGERVMRPDYGCDIYRLIFSPNDDTTAGLAIHYVRQALERWEPRIQQVRVAAERNARFPERLEIIIEYRIQATQQAQVLPFSINLAGEETNDTANS